jgi:hypothetical protein
MSKDKHQDEYLSERLTLAWLEIFEEYLLWREHQIEQGRYKTKNPERLSTSMITGFKDYINEVLIKATFNLPPEKRLEIERKFL